MESRLTHAYRGYLEYQVKCNLKQYNGEWYETYLNVFGVSITIEPTNNDFQCFNLISNTDKMKKIFSEHLGDVSFYFLSRDEIKRMLDKLVANGVNEYGNCVKIIM